MDTLQILEGTKSLLHDFPNFNFIGVFAADQIPLDCGDFAYPLGFIVNTDPITEPGTHWVAIYFHDASNYEFFDSFAQKINLYPFIFDALHSFSCIDSSPYPIQPLQSNKCGNFSMYFILCKAMGYNFQRVFSNFSPSNLNSNDNHISRFDIYSKHRHHHLTQFSHSNFIQICKCRKYFK